MAQLENLKKIRWGLMSLIGLALLMLLLGDVTSGFLPLENRFREVANKVALAGYPLFFLGIVLLKSLEQKIYALQPTSIPGIEKLVQVRRLMLLGFGLGVLLVLGGGDVANFFRRESLILVEIFEILEGVGRVLFFTTIGFSVIYVGRLDAANARAALWDENWQKTAAKAIVVSYLIVFLALAFAPLLNIYWEVEFSDLFSFVMLLAFVLPVFLVLWLDRRGAEGDEHG